MRTPHGTTEGTETVDMVLAEARNVDLAVNDETVAQAETDARDAEEAAAVLARQAVEASQDKMPKAATIMEAREMASVARQRAGRVRMLADKARAARRLLDLEALGKEVEAVFAAASTPDAGIVAAVRKIAEGRAELDAACAGHDNGVRALIGRAKELDPEPPAPAGPRATSAHIAVGTDMVQSGSAVVRVIGEATVKDAAAKAASGDAETALTVLHAARRQDPPERAERYFLGAGGSVHAVSGEHVRHLEEQARKKQGRWLEDGEVEEYLAGRFA